MPPPPLALSTATGMVCGSGRQLGSQTARLLLLLPLLHAGVSWELVISKREDLACAKGAHYTDIGPMNTKGMPGIRSGDPGDQLGECSTLVPAPQPISRVELDYRYVVGYDYAADKEGPVLSVWVHNGPDFSTEGGTGGQSVYTSQALPDRKNKLDYTFDQCAHKDRQDCYSPPVHVDGACDQCVGRFLSLKVQNNDRNLQLMLPITLRINEVSSWGWEFLLLVAAFALAAVVLASVFNRQIRGKRGWNVLPAMSEVRGLVGLVRDGAVFSAARLRPTQRRPVPSPDAQPSPGSSAARTTLIPAETDGVRASLLATKQQAAGVSGKRASKAVAGTLHHAASSGDVETLQAHLRAADGADGRRSLLDTGDARQWTPFHLACANGHVQCVALLVGGGCDTTLRNRVGFYITPSHRDEARCMACAARLTPSSDVCRRDSRAGRLPSSSAARR